MENKTIEWVEASPNNEGIKTIAYNGLGKDFPNVGKIVGYNGIDIYDKVVYKGKEYTVVMVSRLGDFGLSDTGKLPYSIRVKPEEVRKVE